MRLEDKDETNEYGVKVAWFKCDTCGTEYSVCPAPDDDNGWNNCLAEGCESYDPDRDADVLFESSSEVAKRELISMKMLRKRKKYQNDEIDLSGEKNENS